MEGEGSWRFLYDSDSDDELLRFARGDTAVPAERQQQQQVLAAHHDGPPAYPVATAAADAQPVVSGQQMMAGLPSASAMQLDHHQAPPMVHVQQPQPAPAMAFQPRQPPSMIHSRYPQPAPAMPLEHQQMPGESPATVLFHDQHMMGESSSAMPLHHQQMLVHSPATMQPQHQQMQGLSEPSLEVMSTLEYQRIMADLGLTDLYVEDEEVHLPGDGGAASIPDPEPLVLESGLHNDQIPKPSQKGGEGQFFAAAPQPGDYLGPSGAASILDPEPAVTAPVVAPAQPEQGSCEHCYVVREVRNHSALGPVTLSVHRATDGTYTHIILELKGTAAQGPNSGTQRIYRCLRDLTPESAPDLRDLTPESAPEYVESCIHKMRNKAAAPPTPPTEQEEKETRRYLREAAAMAVRELGSLASEVRSVRNQRAPDSNSRKVLFSRFHVSLGTTTSFVIWDLVQLRELNHKIKRFEKDSAKRVGSELSKIRREVDGFVMEKRQLYDMLKELMQRVTKNCHRPPPCGNDDQAGGSGAAGAAVS
uniref:Uncharacterized protein n=1 Tax=Aegilops tauschii TaxID=37682 RepID=M8B5E8_AEGTA